MEKTLENFDLKRLPQKAARQVKSLQDGTFLDRKENVLAFGNPGSGKTHLLSALGRELIRAGRRAAFTTCTRLAQDLLFAKKELRLSRAIRKLAYYEALVIDDLGYVQQSRDEMEVLFTLLAERYERGSMLISSNLPFSKWEAIFKDPMTTAAAIDRLVHHSVIHRTEHLQLSDGAGEEEKGGRRMTGKATREKAWLSWRLRLQASGIYRDPAIPGGPSKIKTGGTAACDAASRPGLAPEPALGLHPCRALPSAPVKPRSNPV